MDLKQIQADHFHDECGIFGIYNHEEAATITYLGLYALQHRGQESCGIVTSDGEQLYSYVTMGLVTEIIDQDKLQQLPGTSAIGHVRYSTTGSSNIKNAQPIVVDCWRGGLGMGHNGNLVNAKILRSNLERKGSIFSSTNDTEVMIHLIARSQSKNMVEATIEALQQVKGAYSLILISETQLIGVRDPHGVRPLSLGRLGESYILSSESCAFDLIEAEYIRDIEPGELVCITKSDVETYKPFDKVQSHPCIFEHIYFARPDSYLFGETVGIVRKKLGKYLCKESHVDADMVIPVPDSGVMAAIGYAEQAKIPFEMGLIRNHYVGRTFIEPQQSIRNFGVKIKLNPLKDLVRGKRVILVDDSIVRGTTSQKLVGIFKQAGAKEVHMRISSPPTRYPCYYGIDTPNRKQLIAATHSVKEIRDFLEAESLAYLSIDGLLKAANSEQHSYCIACFNGDYPVKPPHQQQPQLQIFDESVFSKKKVKKMSK